MSGSNDPISSFNIKLRTVARALTVWSRTKIGNLQLQFAAAQELILRLESAQDERALTTHESTIRSVLKSRCLGLAVLLRIKQHQRVKVSWLKDSMSSSKMFFIKANSQAKRNAIHSMLNSNGVLLNDQEGILDTIGEHFKKVMGTPSETSSAFC